MKTMVRMLLMIVFAVAWVAASRLISEHTLWMFGTVCWGYLGAEIGKRIFWWLGKP